MFRIDCKKKKKHKIRFKLVFRIIQIYIFFHLLMFKTRIFVFIVIFVSTARNIHSVQWKRTQTFTLNYI